MHELADILRRNAGSVLTPELLTGILVSYDQAMADSIVSSVPTRVVDWPTAGDSRLLTNNPERVGKWVADKVGMSGEWGSYSAIGLLNKDGELIAGCVLNDITDTNASAHVAFANKYALKRVLIHAFFEYAFIQLNLKRLTGYVDASNEAALVFDQHLGFEYEHTIKDGCVNGDVHMLVMWRDKCRWLRGQ